MLQFGLSEDIDLWPLFYPFTAGWAYLPSEVKAVTGTPYENEQRLLAGELDVALVSPLTYASHQDILYMLPTPIRSSDLSSDAICLISKKRPDQYEKPLVASAASSAMGTVLLRVLAGRYYGFEPELVTVTSEAAALESLNGASDISILSGEAAIKAAKASVSRGYFAEDLTKAWWILTGVPLPLGLFALRRDWVTANKATAEAQVRALLLSMRSALQHSREQMDTLCEQAATRSGIAAEELEGHYRQQRYELREQQLRGLFEFYRRANELGLAPLVTEPALFPEPSASAKTSSGVSLVKPVPTLEALPKQNNYPTPKPRTSPGEQAQAQGLRVIKGGKADKPVLPKNKRPAPNPREVDEPSDE
jgi:chorismate dehydratase